MDYVLLLSALLIAALLLARVRSDADEDVASHAPVVQAELNALRDENALLRSILEHSRLQPDVRLIGRAGGRLDSLDFASASSPILLFGIDASCAACIESLPIVSEMSIELPCDSRVVGVQMGRYTAKDSARYDLRFPVYTAVHGDFWEVFPFRTIPWMTLVAPGGMVAGRWHGLVTDSVHREVQDSIRAFCPQTQGMTWLGRGDGR